MSRSKSLMLFALGAVLATGAPAQQTPTILVFNAGSLARPLRAALDTFALREHVAIDQESAGSLETARKITELHRAPDVIALADHEVFVQLLMPKYVTWYAQFARNRMVIAYSATSRFAAEITPANWTEVLLREGVETGRSDPNLDPNGYRTLLVLQLAERWYKSPGMAKKLLAAEPARNVRPKSADLVALLQAGELDYIWAYESVAQAAALTYLRLPPEIDLSDPAQQKRYAEASVKVAGRTPRDSLAMVGEPIVFGIAAPSGSPHHALGAKFVQWLLSPEGVKVLRAAKLDALDSPTIVKKAKPPGT